MKEAEKIRKKCVELAKKIVRKQHNFTCEYCGRKEPDIRTHGSHIFSEGVYKHMSSDVSNILVLCYTHHIGGNSKEPSWHKNPIEMTDWFREKYPERYKTLKERARENPLCDLIYWSKKLEELKSLK